jgi:hypothetical protein
MKKAFLFGAVLFSAVTSFSATAATITSDMTTISTTAQSYTNAFILGATNFDNVTLNLTAKGDYGTTSGSENIVFKIDGITLADWTYSTPAINVTNNYSHYDYTLSGTVNIAASLWNTFIADNVLNISWQNGPAVNPYSSQGGPDSVEYSLTGDVAAVPIPAAAFLFAPALLGFMGLRRKAKNTAA